MRAADFWFSPDSAVSSIRRARKLSGDKLPPLGTAAPPAGPTRRAILARLALGEATVMELPQPFEMTQPAISRHLKVLEGAGLIVRRVEETKRHSPATSGDSARLEPLFGLIPLP